LDEIADFEKRFSSMNIRSGYSRKDLEMSYKGLLPASINKQLVKRKEVVRRESSKPIEQVEEAEEVEEIKHVDEQEQEEY